MDIQYKATCVQMNIDRVSSATSLFINIDCML